MTSAPGAAPGARSRWRPLLEVLRAPLLLSPAADVLAGWCLGRLAFPTTADAARPDNAAGLLAGACLAGCCLLAAGMAQNALADRDDDQQRKPERPLPRGAISVTQVRALFAALTAVALAVGLALPPLLPWIAAIVGLSAAYHYALKRHRLPGCVVLGILRGLDMGLGVAAARALAGAAGGADPSPAITWPLLVCVAYGLYITGASLHASTDDEPGPSAWSQRGLGLSQLLLLGGAALAATLVFRDGLLHLLPLGLLLLALVRLRQARRLRPPPAITGVALSNLYLIGSAAAVGSGALVAGLLIAALFGASRLLLRVFPPS